jgi:membrane protease YdiL (CAAX protease family)
LAARPALAFLALAFGWSWGLWLAADALDGAPARGLRLLAAVGPSLAGVTATALASGRPGVRALWARMVHARVGARWYALALIGPAFLWMVAYLYVSAASIRIMPDPAGLALVAPLFVRHLALGGLGQELGWRGWLQPALERRLGFTRASVAVGAIWATWHVPVLLARGDARSPLELALFAALCVAYSLVFARVLHATSGSLLVVVLLHASVNAADASGRALVPALAGAFAVRLVYALYVFGLAAASAYLKPDVRARS